MRTNAPAAKTAALRKPKFRTTLKRIISCKWLYLMLLPCILNFIIFHYIPMYGLQIAFKRYNIVLGAAASPWVGFKHFESFFGSYYFAEVMGNTLRISILSILIGFPAPILFALILNEVNGAGSATTQSCTWPPSAPSIRICTRRPPWMEREICRESGM